MKTKAIMLLTIGLLMVASVTLVFAKPDGVPPLPQAFYGDLTVNGSPAAVGTNVEATGEGVLTGIAGNPIVTTEAGKYGSASPLGAKLIVQGEILDGATITFLVNGVSADQTAEWHSGVVTELNLTAPEPPNSLPTASITSPANNASFLTSDTIAFTGSGNDAEDGALTGGSLVWTSNISGQIGTGASFTGSLNVGSHTITLTATDSEGATGAASVAVTVSAPLATATPSPTATPAPVGDGGDGFFVPPPAATPAPTAAPTPAPTAAPTPGPTLTPPAVVSETTSLVSPDQETRIETPDGQVTLVIQAGSLPPEVATLTVEVEVKNLDPATVPAPPSGTVFLRAVEINTLLNSLPTSITYTSPVVLSFPLTPEEIALAGDDLTKLAVFRFNPQTGAWDILPTTLQESPPPPHLEVRINTFSLFAVGVRQPVGPLPATTPVPTPVPTATAVPTPVVVPTATALPAAGPTPVPTPLPAATLTPLPTATAAPAPVATVTPPEEAPPAPAAGFPVVAVIGIVVGVLVALGIVGGVIYSRRSR